MGNLLSKKKPKKEITDADRAVLSLKTQKRKFGEQRKRIEAVIDREIEIARELIRVKKKERALLALKKKKLHEQQLANIDSWILNVEQMLLDIESAKRNKKLFTALEQGNAALKQFQTEMPIEQVEALMEESAEAKAHEQQIQRLLGENFREEDAEAVLQELEAMETVVFEEEAAELPTPPRVDSGVDIAALPQVPTHEVEVNKQQQAEEIAKPEKVAELAS